jgi:hypothetical protein
MGWARNGLAPAALRHEDTPLRHLQSADDSLTAYVNVFY